LSIPVPFFGNLLPVRVLLRLGEEFSQVLDNPLLEAMQVLHGTFPSATDKKGDQNRTLAKTARCDQMFFPVGIVERGKTDIFPSRSGVNKAAIAVVDSNVGNFWRAEAEKEQVPRH